MTHRIARYVLLVIAVAGCESPTAVLTPLADTIETFRYASTIDPIPDLFARCRSAREGLPVVILMHGLGGDASSAFPPAVYEQLSRQAVTVCALGMRGRDGASGNLDINGREIHDIIDGLAVIRQRYRTQAPAAIVGFSGGGSNALATAARYPAAFRVTVSYFGISDFGAWYQTAHPVYRDFMETWIGGTPAELPDAYRQRDFLPGLSAFRGYLFAFHDVEDATVPPWHSERLRSLARTTVAVSRPTDAVRFHHGHPTDSIPGQAAWLARLR